MVHVDLINILEELKKFKASELSLFSNATIPEKYLDKFFELNSLKLLLLDNKGSDKVIVKLNIIVIFF